MRRNLALASRVGPLGSPRPATSPHVVRGWLVAWSGMVVLALVNGTFRALVTQPLLGETAARQLATLILLGALVLYQWELARRLPIPTARLAWALGGAWTAMTLAFEFGFGRFVEHLSWSTMLADYDVTRGRIWILVPLTLLVLPWSVRALRSRAQRRTGTGRGRRLVGGFFLFTGGVHLGIVAADTEYYRRFADGGLFGFVRTGWADIFMAHPAFWGLIMVLGETTLGALLLTGGRAARVGWLGVIAFHLLLMLFGFGFWLWCLPALAVLVTLARRDWPALSRR